MFIVPEKRYITSMICLMWEPEKEKGSDIVTAGIQQKCTSHISITTTASSSFLAPRFCLLPTSICHRKE